MTGPGRAPGITLLLGGVRAGKSTAAVRRARETLDPRGVLFAATAEAGDDEMRRRIDAHRRERPADWDTLESPRELVRDLESSLAGRVRDVIVIDCLTLWVSNLLLAWEGEPDAEKRIAGEAERLAELMRRHPSTWWIVVSNEVGLGVVPPTSLGRAYRDALGRTNQIVARAADEVILMVAGIELAIKHRP